MPPLRDHFAILVAINRYPGVSPLGGPENDAIAFRDWLRDRGGGNVHRDNIVLICSSDSEPAATPDHEHPTETELKIALNRWLKVKGKWVERAGQRLYLFFAGHGFTAGSLTDPALYTAQAQMGDTVHIAALRYAGRISSAGFFDEIVLVMDCCQDVLKASQVNEPTWTPPDRYKSSDVKFMQAFGAPRGKKTFETDGVTPPVRGYFSSVFLEALRSARSDSEGYVTARAVQERIETLWFERSYAQKFGYQPPPLPAPANLLLYRREKPPSMETPEPPGMTGVLKGVPGIVFEAGDGLEDQADGLDGAAGGFEGAAGGVEGETGGFEGAFAGPELGPTRVTISTEPGALIRVVDADGAEVARGVGRVEETLDAGTYDAQIRLGDATRTEIFGVAGEPLLELAYPLSLEFSSPVPMKQTSTNHEYHWYPAADLRATAAQWTLPDRGTLMVFARDHAYDPWGSQWSMPLELRQAIRVRFLDPAGVPHVLSAPVITEKNEGRSSILFSGLTPGTYLIGVKQRAQQHWIWEELVVTVAPGWRTEIYIDSSEDEWTGRRFDMDSASVLVRRGPAEMNADDQAARIAEVARLNLLERRVWTTDLDAALRAAGANPIVGLCTAYAMTFSRPHRCADIETICDLLSERWGTGSADVKLLKAWAASGGRQIRTEFAPGEAPMFSRGWELLKQSGAVSQLSLDVQRYIGARRIVSPVWKQIQIPDGEQAAQCPEDIAEPLLTSEDDDAVRAIAGIAPAPTLTPMQQALRRIAIDITDENGSATAAEIVSAAEAATGLDPRIIVGAFKSLTSLTQPAVQQPATAAAAG